MLSRYKEKNLFIDDSVRYYAKRNLYNFNLDDIIFHTFKQSDTLDNLAYQYYGDSNLWWVILEANKDKFMHIMDITYGSKLVIPSKMSVMEVINE